MYSVALQRVSGFYKKTMEYVLSVVGVPARHWLRRQALAGGPQLALKKAFAPFGVLGAHLYDHFIPHARNNYHPHLLGHRALALISGLLVALKIFTLTIISIGPVLPAFSSAITPANIISLTNQSRQEFNLNALTESAVLDKAAQDKADDMLAKGYFAHVTPDGRTPWSFMVAAGYNYLMAGENLAVNFTEAENVETAWMNSPGHKANIINKNFEEIGIGIAQGTYQDHTAIFVVQMFGVPAEQKISLTDSPTPVQTAALPAPAPAKTPVKVRVSSAELQPAAVVPAPAPAVSNPLTLGDNQQEPVAPAPPETVVVAEGNVKLDGSTVNITAEVSGPVVKVIAYFGQQAIMLLPKSNNVWTGQVPLSVLAQTNSTVKLKAFGMAGQSGQLQLADFSASTMDNYNLSGASPDSYVTFLNKTFNPKSFESHFYLFFIAGLLSSLVLAIAIKRHVQHLSLIANTSFVVIFASLLFMAG